MTICLRALCKLERWRYAAHNRAVSSATAPVLLQLQEWAG